MLKIKKICLRTYYITGHIKQPRRQRVGQPWFKRKNAKLCLERQWFERNRKTT